MVPDVPVKQTFWIMDVINANKREGGEVVDEIPLSVDVIADRTVNRRHPDGYIFAHAVFGNDLILRW